MSPHNCAGVICRIIGFSKVQGLVASPYLHAAMRRDCVYPKTKLFFYNKKNMEIFYDEIGDYVENLIEKGAKTTKIDAFGTLRVDIDEELYCVGIDPNTHELKSKKIKFFVKGPKTEEWVKITTATNREYIMTPTHKFMYISDRNFKFKDASTIEVNDRLPVLEKFDFKSNIGEINLIKLFNEKLSKEEKSQIIVIKDGIEKNFLEICNEGNENFKDSSLRLKFSKYVIPNILNINEDLMRLLGYFVSEGYSRINKWVAQISFRICYDKSQEHLKELIRKVFGIKCNIAEENTKITLCSKLVYYIFKCIGIGNNAYNKRIPCFMFGLDKALIKEFLSTYLEGDGSIIKNKNIVFYSVSRELLDDIALLLNKFGAVGRYFRTGLRLPGEKVLERYKELNKTPKKHILNHLVFGVYDSFKLSRFLSIVHEEKAKKLFSIANSNINEKRYLKYNGKQFLLEAQSDYIADFVKKVERVKETGNSYCVEIDWKEKEDRNVLWGEQIINTRCDGDEAALMLLLDVLINFSRKFLPSHRGGTQDAPLVLNGKIFANEVDDQILDFELVDDYPLELYEKAEKGAHSSEVTIEMVRQRLNQDKDPFINTGFTHNLIDFNEGSTCSSYKTLPSMKDKVEAQMKLCEKLRSVDQGDVARLIIDRHFMRDLKGNLRKFSQQNFRCSTCNSIYRRPPLTGKCEHCKGKLIYTIAYGSIIKYLEPALELVKNYNVPSYIVQDLELTKKYIESIFGKDTEKQEMLKKWF